MNGWLWVPVAVCIFAIVLAPLNVVAKKTPPGGAVIAALINVAVIFCVLKGGGVL